MSEHRSGAEGRSSPRLSRGSLPPAAYGAALATLPGMGPARLAAVLARWRPEQAWDRVRANRAVADPGVAVACRPDPSEVATAWARAAATVDVAAVWAAHRRAGITVALRGSAPYPSPLAGDHEAPAVLFLRGDERAVEGRRVAVVGTRRCTRYGADVARQLGCDLAGAGVTVVSGLALGVDGAAHEGALAARAAPPVAVVGSGLDVVYPRRHARLWAAVAGSGLLLSEAPLGARPEPWRFPVRNRVIAALAEVVVVVESPPRGGSVHTVEAAVARDRPVMAVPGSVRSPASELPNALLAEGCSPARDALDVLTLLGISSSVPPPGGEDHDRRPSPDGDAKAVLDALGWEPATLDHLVDRSGLGPGPASLALARLEEQGWVVGERGWWQRAACPSPGGRR
ncbi:MAG TPA: DNA-processing protein DprA [Acidimicrobiales bacterium]|nr:DNA-processing protein DprA [Acidimicrobiales bacterium]